MPVPQAHLSGQYLGDAPHRTNFDHGLLLPGCGCIVLVMPISLMSPLVVLALVVLALVVLALVMLDSKQP